MKRLGFCAFFIACSFVLLANSLLAQSDMMILDSMKGLPGKKRPPVPFPHNLHVEKGWSCKDCHHLYEKGKNVLDESSLTEGNKKILCSSCHGSKARLNLEQAYHAQCMGCHKKPLKEQKKAPPRYCGGCHVRK